MRFYYKVRLLFRNDPLLGLFHFIRKNLLKGQIKFKKTPDEINTIFLIKENDAEIFSFFESNKLYKRKLLQIANDFVKQEITVYQKKINLTEFTVDKWNIRPQAKEAYLNDTRFYWEIYRCKYLFMVGLAYYLSKNEDYAQSLIDFLKNWENYSPVAHDKVPYNGMEAALKLINLSWLDCFLKSYKNYDNKIRNMLIRSLVLHAEYIYRNYEISFYGLESNHSLACSIGLLYASLLFPSYKNSQKWRRLGARSLKRALKKQFTNDGVNFESSVHYHRFTFEMLLFLMAVYYANGVRIDPNIEQSVKKIGEALKALTHKNGNISRFGDNDGGKFLYDTGSVEEFNKLDYLNWFYDCTMSVHFETLIFLNIPQLKNFLLNKNHTFKVGGYVTYKDSNISLIISGNEIGTSGKGNHQHNDFLSFELYSECPFIVDCWSYCYTGNRDLRNKDRKTISHNTIQIDGREIVEFDENKLFEMLGDIKVNIEKAIDNEKMWTVTLKHNGYKNLKGGRQIHSRKFIYDKSNKELKIIDTLSGKGKHVAKLNLHIPQKYWELEENGSKLIFSNDKETFTLTNNLGKFNIANGSISEYFLNHASSYYISLEKKYIEQIEIELSITYTNQ